MAISFRYDLMLTEILQILRLAKASDMTVERLFGAFWDTIAIEAVKDLLIRPQTTQLMADLLGISVSEFLVLTQSYTLPWLVLVKNTDVIKRISDARKDGNDWIACMEASNLVPILALLLQQNVSDMENFIMSLLKCVSQRFKQLDLTDLMRVEPSSQAFYLLKAAGEADDSKKSRVYFLSKLGLSFLTTPRSGMLYNFLLVKRTQLVMEATRRATLLVLSWSSIFWVWLKGCQKLSMILGTTSLQRRNNVVLRPSRSW